MNSFTIPFVEISPITKLKTVVYTKIQIDASMRVGDNYALLKVLLFTDIQDELKELTYEISGDDYKQWTDDAYLIQFVKNKLRYESF
jgi:hypothetical protein